MPWYGVHVVMAVRFKSGSQNVYPVWENIYLVQANDADEASRKAENFGRENEGDSSGSFQWDERPAEWTFQGVRKVIEVANPRSVSNEPGDGAEVTYQTLEFDSAKALEDYVAAEPTVLKSLD